MEQNYSCSLIVAGYLRCTELPAKLYDRVDTRTSTAQTQAALHAAKNEKDPMSGAPSTQFPAVRGRKRPRDDDVIGAGTPGFANVHIGDIVGVRAPWVLDAVTAGRPVEEIKITHVDLPEVTVDVRMRDVLGNSVRRLVASCRVNADFLVPAAPSQDLTDPLEIPSAAEQLVVPGCDDEEMMDLWLENAIAELLLSSGWPARTANLLKISLVSNPDDDTPMEPVFFVSVGHWRRLWIPNIRTYVHTCAPCPISKSGG